MISKTTTTLTIGRSRLPVGMSLWKAGKDIRAFLKERAPRRAKITYTAPLTIDVMFKHEADAVVFFLNYQEWFSTADVELELASGVIGTFLTDRKVEYDVLPVNEQKLWVAGVLRLSPYLNPKERSLRLLRMKRLMEGLGWLWTESGWRHPSEIAQAARAT